MIKEEFQSAKASLQGQMDGFVLTPLNLNRVTAEQNGKSVVFKSEGLTMRHEAVCDMANLLGLKTSTPNKVKKDNNWTELAEALSQLQGRTMATGLVDAKMNAVVSLQRKAVEGTKQVTFEKPLSLIESYIESVQGDLTLGRFWFSPELYQIGFRFNNPSVELDVFKDKKDFWTPGVAMTFDQNQFRVANHFLRLVCLNGATAEEELERTYIGNKDLSQGRFNKTMDHYMSVEGLEEGLQEKADVARSCNASVNELVQARAIVNEVFSKPLAERFNKEHFDITPVTVAYARHGIDTKKMSRDTKKRADTNINAYDFFNSLTYLASHEVAPQEVTSVNRFNTLASSVFFRGPDLASSVINPFLN